mgnify:CR=1 FL=1
MTSCKSLLTDYRKFDGSTVKFGGNSSGKILLSEKFHRAWQADEFITGKCKDDTETCSGEVANDYGKTGGIGVQEWSR